MKTTSTLPSAFKSIGWIRIRTLTLGVFALMNLMPLSADPLPFPRLIVCDGNGTLNAAAMTELRDMGVEAINFDINWSQLEVEEGVYEWKQVDAYVNAAKEADMPLYAGLAFHYAPTWLEEKGMGLLNQYGDNSIRLAPSRRYPGIWHPEIRSVKQRFIRAVGERYGDDLAAVFVSAGELGELQFISSVPGRPPFSFIWAFDPHALEDFRSFLRDRYEDVSEYTRKSGRVFSSFEEVMPPTSVHESLNDLDFLEWKHGSLVDHAEFLVRASAEYWKRIGIKHNVALGHNRLLASTGTGSHTTSWIGEIAERVRPDVEVFACWGMLIVPTSHYGAKVAREHGIKFMNEHAILDLPAGLSWSEKAGIDSFSYFNAGSLYDPDNNPYPKLEEFRWFIPKWLGREKPESVDSLRLEIHGRIHQIDHPRYEVVLGSDYPTAGMMMSLKARGEDGTLGENPLVAFSPATAWLDGVPYAQMRAGELESAPRVVHQSREKIVLEVTGELQNAVGQKRGWAYEVRYHFFADRPEIEVSARLLPKAGSPLPDRFGAWILTWPPFADTVTEDFVNLATGVDGPQSPRPTQTVAVEGQDHEGFLLKAASGQQTTLQAGPHRARDSFDGLGFPQRAFHMWMSPPANYFIKDTQFTAVQDSRAAHELNFSIHPYRASQRWQAVQEARPVLILAEQEQWVLRPTEPEARPVWEVWNRSERPKDIQWELLRNEEVVTENTETLSARGRFTVDRLIEYDDSRSNDRYRLQVKNLGYDLHKDILVMHRNRIEVFSDEEAAFILEDRSFRSGNRRFTDRTAVMKYRFPRELFRRGIIRLRIGQQYDVEALAEGTPQRVHVRNQARAATKIIELNVRPLLDSADNIILTIRDSVPEDGYGAIWDFIELE